MSAYRSLMQILLVMLAAMAVGCETETRVLSTSFGFEPTSSGSNDWNVSDPPSGPTHEESDGEWTIALGQFKGENHHARAEYTAERIAAYAETDDLWLDEVDDGTMVYFSRYGSRNDPIAQADLRRWRQFVRTGQMRLPALMLVPVGQGIEATGAGGDDSSAYALQNASDRGEYTLQIGMYDEDFGDDFREAAEEAVATLREDGWEAYYWHGPVRSTVTIGVFGEELHNDESDEARTFQALQERFPHNSLNGRTLRERRGDEVHEQPSFPVHIPTD